MYTFGLCRVCAHSKCHYAQLLYNLSIALFFETSSNNLFIITLVSCTKIFLAIIMLIARQIIFVHLEDKIQIVFEIYSTLLFSGFVIQIKLNHYMHLSFAII